MKPIACAMVLLGAAVETTLGQCEFSGSSATPINPVVETVGGISYLKFSYQSTCPQELWKSAPIVSGTNVSQSIFLLDGPQFCIPVFPPPVDTREASLVLGPLSPGNYLCRIFTTLSFGGSLWPVAHVPFTVPDPEPTLTLVSAGPARMVLRVNGTTNVLYRVQSSVNLTNWTTFNTHPGAPYIVTHSPSTNTFYRVRISDEVPLCQ